VQHAHQKGVIHRDIKPSNVVVGLYDGRPVPKIIDFGVAKAAGKLSQTVVGTIKGKHAYMSPEQARGEKLDARSDLFSFGIVLYEMATGRRAFAGSTTAVVFDEILNRMPTPPTRVNPQLPRGLDRQQDAVERKCLVVDVRIALEPGVGWYQVIGAIDLDTVTRVVDDGNVGIASLIGEFPQRPPHVGGLKIESRVDKVETRALQGPSDGCGVIGRVWKQSCVLVVGVADHERDALLSQSRLTGQQERSDKKKTAEPDVCMQIHGETSSKSSQYAPRCQKR